MNFAGTAKDDAMESHGSAGFAARVAQGGVGSNFSPTGARGARARKGRTDPLSVAGDCLPHRP